MKTLACALSLACLLASPLALAQPRSAETQQAQVTTYGPNSFLDDPITGTRRSPLGDTVTSRSGRRLPPLYHVRTQFVPEMLKSVENQ